jgi:hypothetical protein
MIKDRNIADNAMIQLSKIAGGGIGSPIGNVRYVAYDDCAAHDWLESRVPSDKLYTTINEAANACTANRGDSVIVAPGHVETVTAAGDLALGIAGVSLLGLGYGAARPQINFTTATTADMDIDAASITMSNFLLTGGVDELASPIDVNAADFSMVDCEVRDVTGQMVIAMATDANADRMKLIRPVFRLAAAAGSTEAIRIIGGDDIEIVSPKIYGNFSAAAINVHTTAAVRLMVYGNADCPAYIWNANASDIGIKDTVTGSTGFIGPNINIMVTDNAATITEAVTGATFQLFDPVYVCNLAGEKAMLINWTASTDDA